MNRSLFALVLSAQLSLVAHSQTSGMEIGVRSGIDLTEKARRDHDPAYARDDSKHQRRYLLISIKEIKTDEKLKKPMDAQVMARELNKVLEAQGFHPVVAGEKPEIIIKALYGRGMILNPYMDPDNYPPGDFRRGLRGPQNISNSIQGMKTVTHDSFVGLRDKTAALNYEKLAIQVSAYQYPPPPNPKTPLVMVWTTTMYADDPDNRDLNLIMPKLLASGAPYFDRHIDREKEVKIMTDLPDGHVRVGTPEVVSEAKK